MLYASERHLLVALSHAHWTIVGVLFSLPLSLLCPAALSLFPFDTLAPPVVGSLFLVTKEQCTIAYYDVPPRVSLPFRFSSAPRKGSRLSPVPTDSGIFDIVGPSASPPDPLHRVLSSGSSPPDPFPNPLFGTRGLLPAHQFSSSLALLFFADPKDRLTSTFRQQRNRNLPNDFHRRNIARKLDKFE